MPTGVYDRPGWTPERIETMKELYLAGQSCSQIARALGGTTRNAVIGKIHRLGLSGAGRATPSAPSQTHLKRPAKPRVNRGFGIPNKAPPVAKGPANPLGRPCTAPDIPLPPEAPEEPGSATIHTLGARMRKWPIGDPAADDFTFCGRRINGGAYCTTHDGRAHLPASKKGPDGKELARALRRYI